MTAGRILLVEDDADTRALYRLFLEMGGYEVLEAEDGEEALRRASGAAPALVLTDLSLPGIDGRETARRLRASPGTAAVPVVALSAHAAESVRREALQDGFAGYLVKPVDPDRLLAEVGRVLCQGG